MTKVVPGLRSMLVTGVILGLGSMAGCGGDGISTGTSSGSIDRSGSGNPTGTPVTGTPPNPAPPPTGSKSNAVTLSWDAPTENTDGSTLADLKGYKVHYGQESNSYKDTIQIANPGLTTYVVQNLPAGKYYFAISAYNSANHESSLSGEVATQVD